MKEALIIFVKNPEMGKAKTRLAKTVGDEKAFEVYKQLLAYTRNVCSSLVCDKFLFYTQFIDNQDQWSNETFEKYVQSEGDLGDKMLNAFKTVFDLGYEKALIIGSDCAQLEAKHLSYAYDELKNKDVVIGPALDGGYYLLGMKELQKCLFEDKSWSTSNLIEETKSDLDKLGLTYHLLETLNDVDTEKDYLEVKHRLTFE